MKSTYYSLNAVSTGKNDILTFVRPMLSRLYEYSVNKLMYIPVFTCFAKGIFI